MSLTIADQRRITAARGWLELGDHLSAFEELECMAPTARALPEVLKLRWEIYNKAGKHGSAFVVAEGLTRLLPDDPQPFIWRAHSTRQMDSIHRATQMLIEVANKFADEPTFPFNIACYNSKLGNFEQAKAWLYIAWEVATKQNTAREWKLRAIDEKDLEPLWDEIRGLK
jgi:hypothetical protein